MNNLRSALSNAGPSSPEDVPAHFDLAFNRADVDAALEVFDIPATMRMANGQVIEENRSDLRTAFEDLLSPQPEIHEEIRCVLRCEDLALVLMDWTVTTRDADGQERVDRGTATQVMKRQLDGSWRLKISNPLGIA